MADATAEAAAALFRPSKKQRKAYRQRADDPDQSLHVEQAPLTSSAPQTAGPTRSLDPPVPLSDPDSACALSPSAASAAQTDASGVDREDEDRVFRVRSKARPYGVAFRSGRPSSSAAAAPASTPPPSSIAEGTGGEMVLHEAAPSSALEMPARFAAATGLTTELHTRHMMEYIESGLARRHNRQPNPSSTTTATTATTPPTTGTSASTTTAPDVPFKSQPAALRGRILEVDLGDEMRSRNVEMTERAARRLAVDGPADVDSPHSDPDAAHGTTAAKRNRRGSEDLKRDKLVEDFLHENRLDVYDLNPTTGVVQSSGGNYFSADLDIFNNPTTLGDDPDAPNLAAPGCAADDRIAEQFRREFMEALQERQQLRRRKRKAASNAPARPRNDGPGRGAGGPSAATAGKPGKKDDGEILRGPKLGGSRNDRAQMRDILLANQNELKKPTSTGLAGRRR